MTRFPITECGSPTLTITVMVGSYGPYEATVNSDGTWEVPGEVIGEIEEGTHDITVTANYPCPKQVTVTGTIVVDDLTTNRLMDELSGFLVDESGNYLISE